jgi:hypothetical protein
MEIKKSAKAEKTKDLSRKAANFLFRWSFLILFLAVAVYAVWAWDNFVYYADWSEEKKQAYINEQAVFSFDRGSYQKAVDLIKLRKEKLESDYRFSGKDVFFPEGF